MKCWLKSDVMNTCKYHCSKYTPKNATIYANDNMQSIDEFRTLFEHVYNISFQTNDESVFDFFKDNNNYDIYLSRASKFSKFKYIPWITKNNIPYFAYINDSHSTTKVAIKPCSNILEFYSTVKILNMGIVNDEYKNDITTYYDSLPQLDTISYLFGLPHVSFEEEITIEI